MIKLKSLLPEDIVSGGLSDEMSLSDIAKKHNVSIEELNKEFEMGMKVEMEHTTDKEIAKEIARDHLFEDPKYYTKLSSIETNEDLRKWLGSGGEGGVGGGGWDRYNSKGERVGKCGDAKEGEPYSACLSKEKAEKLGKKGRASFVNRKRAAQKKAGDAKKGGEQKKGQKPTYVKTGA
jgi:hypothetical protein